MEDFKQVEADLLRVIARLVEPTEVVRVTGAKAMTAPLVSQVRESLTSVRTDTPPSTAYKGKPPLWVIGFDWEQQVFKAVKPLLRLSRLPRPCQSVVEALSVAESVRYAPEHTEVMRRACRLLTQRVHEALHFIYPPLFEVEGECPQCKANKVTVTNETGRITRNAITVHEYWAECGSCGTQWESTNIIDLLAPMMNTPQPNEETSNP